MNNSSFGGAEIGTEQAQAAAQAGLVGQQYYTNELNDWLNTRSNYYDTAVQAAFNQATGVQQTEALQLQNAQQSAADALQAAQINAQEQLGLQSYAFQSPQLQNAFNLQSTGLANQFSSNVYGTQAGILGSQLGYNASLVNSLGLLGK